MSPATGRLSAFVLSILMSLGAPAAHAWPTRVVERVEGGTTLTDVAISSDGLWVAFAEGGTSQVYLLDTRSWEKTSQEPCADSTARGVAFLGEGDAVDLYVGCANGDIVEIPIVEGQPGTATAVCAVTSFEVMTLEAGDDLVYAIGKAVAEEGGEDVSDNPAVHTCDPADGAVDEASGSWPSQLNMSTVNDAALMSGYLLVTHGNDDVSKVDLSTGAAVLPTDMNSALKLADLCVYENVPFIAAGSGGVVQYNTGSNEFSVLMNSNSGLTDAQALAVDDEGEPAMLVYTPSTMELVVYSFDTGSLRPDDEVLTRFAADDIYEMVAGAGYSYGGGSGGALQIMTDRPWIYDVTLDTPQAQTGATVRLSFYSDVSGSYRIYVGGSITGWEGAQVASGSVTADVAAVESIVVDDIFEEGENNIWIRVDDGDLTGHGAAFLTVDNPPGVVTLTEENVRFGSSQATLQFDSLDVSDIGSYEVYVSVTPFSAQTYPTGGPVFDGTDALETPISLDPPATAGDPVSTTISPLTNGVTYYIGVRAVDLGGLEGEMSDVVSVVPEQGVGAASLAGETGGCATTGTRPGGWALLLGALAGAMVARRRGVLAAALVGAGLLPASAQAASDPNKARKGTVELRYGWWTEVGDPNISSVYTEGPHNMLWLEGGPKLGRFLELDLGAGFYQELAWTVTADEDQEQSGEHLMMTAWPLTAGATFRLDAMRDQFLVPAVGLGFDWWTWRENWYVNPDVGGASSVKGGKAGWHYALSLGILLDALEPGRASALEVRTGIKDTYLTAEWRRQQVGLWDEDGGLTFDGDQVTVGLDMDF